MEFLEVEGKTVELAIEKALEKLNITKESACIKVIDEGTKGILGFGSKPAIVQVCEKVNVVDKVEPFIKEFVNLMNLDIDYSINTLQDNKIEVNFVGNDVKFLIGKRGITLNAMQNYLNLVFNKISNYRVSVIVNIGDYREKRKETLEKLAASVVEKVKISKKPYTLNPMTSFERKVIHTALHDIANIQTHSIGEEPNRRVVVTYVE